MKDFIHKLNANYSSKGLSKISSDYFDKDYLSQDGVKVFENINGNEEKFISHEIK